MFKHTYLQVKDCPICGKQIYLFSNGKPVALNDEGMTFYAKYNDGSLAEYSICKSCFPALTQEQVDKLMQDEIYTEGMQIICTPLGILDFTKQIKNYVETTVHLRIVKWGVTKDAVTA
jgi:hypothetical protein